MKTTTIPASKNTEWGFYGSMKDKAEAAWPIAMTSIAEANKMPLESVRVFLDSRHGRHFSDDVLNWLRNGRTLSDAIDASIRQWMGCFARSSEALEAS